MGLISSLFNAILTYPIFNALMELYHLLGDFGLSIIVLTCLTYLITLPLTLRQRRIASIKQALQPQIAEINRRYAHDPLAQFAARQELYKEHHISSLATYLPLLIQTLIFSGLFFALNTVLHGATLSAINTILYPFVAHFVALPNFNLSWFTILNAAWHISLAYPDPTHILPLLTGLVTLIQMLLAQSMTTREGILQIPQATQLIVPLIGAGITVFFAWQFASGVALYRLVTLILNMIQQFFIMGRQALQVTPGIVAGGSGGATMVRGSISEPNEAPRASAKTRRQHRRSSARRRGKNLKKRHQ